MSFETATITGTLRDCTPAGKGRRRLSEGDIAVINAPDLSRREAQFLIDARPQAVVNLAQFSTGAVPNYGPLMLLDAEIVLVEAEEGTLLSGFRDGAKKGQLEFAADNSAVLSNASKEIGTGVMVTRAAAEERFADAQRVLVASMEAYFGNSVEFLQSEAPLLIDGVGVPEIGEDISGRKAVVVAPGADHREQVEGLRNFIREYDPVLIAVGKAADTLMDLKYQPHFIVGDPLEVSTETLRSGARVILPADPDGHAVGLERIQDLGIGAMTFPAALGNHTDMALLLAGYHEAELIVVAGENFSLDEIFAHPDQAHPGSLLTRTKIAPRLIDAQAVISMYRVAPSRSIGWLWAILGILVAVATVILIIGFGGDGSFADNLINTWNSFALWVQGLFR